MTGFSPLKSCGHSSILGAGHPGQWLSQQSTQEPAGIFTVGDDLQAHSQKHD